MTEYEKRKRLQRIRELIIQRSIQWEKITKLSKYGFKPGFEDLRYDFKQKAGKWRNVMIKNKMMYYVKSYN